MRDGGRAGWLMKLTFAVDYDSAQLGEMDGLGAMMSPPTASRQRGTVQDPATRAAE